MGLSVLLLDLFKTCLMINFKIVRIDRELKYSQTYEQRPGKGDWKYGRCLQVTFVQG